MTGRGVGILACKPAFVPALGPCDQPAPKPARMPACRQECPPHLGAHIHFHDLRKTPADIGSSETHLDPSAWQARLSAPPWLSEVGFQSRSFAAILRSPWPYPAT